MARPDETGNWATIDDRIPEYGDPLPPLTPEAKAALADLIKDTGGDHEDRPKLEQRQRTRANRLR
jgi:hypothetical protein